MRHAATRSLLERDDVIIVASVSCIYGIGSVENYTAMTFTVKAATHRPARAAPPTSSPCSTSAATPASCAAPSASAATPSSSSPPTIEDRAWRITLFGDEIETIAEFDPLTGKKTAELKLVQGLRQLPLRDAAPTLQQAIKAIKDELPRASRSSTAPAASSKPSASSSAPSSTSR